VSRSGWLALLAALLAAAVNAAEAPRVPEAPPVGEPVAPQPAPAGKPAKPGPRPAVEPPPARPPSDEDPEKLTVTADKAGSQRAGKDEQGRELTKARFVGNVEAVRGEVRLTCRELEVIFVKEAAKAGAESAAKPGQGRARQARATGAVVITMPDRRAVADEALYDMASEQITLTGKTRPVLYHETDAVAADSFVLHRAAKVAEARGKVSAVIGPRAPPEERGAEKKPAPDASDLLRQGYGGLQSRQAKETDLAKAGPSAAKRTRIDAAGGAVYDDARRVLFLKDRVVVQQEGFRLAAERLWVFFQPRAASAPEGAPPPAKAADPLVAAMGGGSLRKLVAAGGVRVETDTRTTDSELAEYDAAGRTVVLAGQAPQPVIHEGENRLTAPQIIYYLDEDRMESRGGAFKAVVAGGKGGLLR
jgi:lipopolysaccharide export system protein LptA